MIVDRLENASLYSNLAPRVTTALAYLRDKDFASMEPGRYDIQGDEIYAMVQEYTTKDANEVKWEAHRQYIDVQYVADGVEQMGYANIKMLAVKKSYDEGDDYELYDGAGSLVTVPAGSFAIFFPEDGHIPGVAMDDKPAAVRKVVVKVAV